MSLIACKEFYELQVNAAYRLTVRIIDHDRTRVGEGLHRVRSVRRNDRGAPGSSDPRLTGYCNFELAIDDVPDLIVGMGMLMDRSARGDRVVRECHVRRMKETPLPALPRFLYAELICFDKRHVTGLPSNENKISHRWPERNSPRITDNE